MTSTESKIEKVPATGLPTAGTTATVKIASHGWRVPALRRIAPVVALPRNLGFLGDALSLIRRPVPLTALAAVAWAGIGDGDYLAIGHRELVALRAAWNCGGYVPYTAHVLLARLVRAGRDDQAAIRNGPDDPTWTATESELLRVVDELQHNFAPSELTGIRARRFFSDHQIADIAAMCAVTEAISMTTGSIGFRPPTVLQRLVHSVDGVEEPGLGVPMSDGFVARRAVVRDTWRPRAQSWSVTDPVVADAVSRHGRLAGALHLFSDVAGRFGVLAAADYRRVADRVGELMAGAPMSPTAITSPAVSGWRRPPVLRRLVDELHTQRFVSDKTWSMAGEIFSERELIDICVLVGGLRTYHFVARATEPEQAETEEK